MRKRESAQLFRRIHSDATETNTDALNPLLRERAALQTAHKDMDNIIG